MVERSTPKMGGMFGGELSGGFLGLPDNTGAGDSTADVVLIGAPIATPYQSVGPYCADAPAAIRSAFGWPGVLDHYDFDLGGTVLEETTTAIDIGDLDLSEVDFASNREAIKAQVQSVLNSGAVPIVLGGDDSTPIPVLQAYEGHGPITILQLDAHIDWRDNVAGEKMGLSSNMRRASELGWVENIIQVGARGAGSARPDDVRDAVEWGVKFIPMIEFEERGVDAVIDLLPDNANVFVALDIDVMDPGIVPAVIGPAPGGMRYWQVVELFKKVAAKNRIAGFDLAELMPANDIGGRGALVAARLTTVMLNLISQQKSRAKSESS